MVETVRVPVRRDGVDPVVAPPQPSSASRSSVAWQLYLVAIFLLPVQIESASVDRIVGSRFAPADVVLALAVLAALPSLGIARRALDAIPLVFVATLAYGLVLALVHTGQVTDHALVVKFGGGLVLAALAVLTAHYARQGGALTIVTTLLAGMAVWGVVAWFDWRLDDALPLLRVKTPSRFGGAQVDPNNAGASFAVALFLTARVGPVLWSRRVRWLMFTLFGVFLAATLSRGAVIGALAAWLVLAVVERAPLRRWLRVALAATVVAAGLVLTGWVSRAVEDFTSRPDNVAGRETLAIDAIDDFAASRGTGVGLGTYLSEHGEIIHNSALWLTTEMSLPGAVLFALVVLVPADAARRLRRHDPELGSALLAAHVVMVVASANIEALYQRPWWVVIGLCATPATVRARSRRRAPVRHLPA